MRYLYFVAACGERLIDVGVASENAVVQAALRACDNTAILTALDNEF